MPFGITCRIQVEGTDIYISTQFFDSDRDAVIDWYKEHIE
jgi:hypothetical protein